MSDYKAAIIGCGRIASTFDDDPLREHPATHAGAYAAVAGISIVAAADLDKKKLDAFGKKWNCTNLFADYNKMLTSAKPDIVSVCLPTQFHCDAVLAAAKAGAKAIFCEKPIAASLEEADRMIEACKKANVKLMYAEELCFTPKYVRLKGLLGN